MKNAFIALVLMGLMLFGCTSPSGPSAPSGASAAGGGAGASGTGAAAGSNGTGAAGAGTSGAGAAGGAANQGAQGGAAGGPGAAAIATYAAAVASGLPLECTVTSNGQTSTIFVRGQQMALTGTASGQPYMMVVKNGVSYMQLSTDMKSSIAQMGKNCDWLVFTANKTASSGGSSAPVSTSDYTAPGVVWSCQPGMFGDEKFLTPGATCDMSTLYSSAGAGAPPYPTGG
jgi:hypothetical protein